MNTNNPMRSLGLSAVIAAAAVLSISLINPAYAADDHNSSRSNKSSSSADKELDKGVPTKLMEDLDTTMTDIDTLLASISENLARASELQAQLAEQSSALSEARMASSEGSEEMLSQIEDARKAFEEHVAPLLDTATVEQVSLNFTKIEFDYKSRAASGEDSDDDGLDSEVEELSTSLSAALAALDACKESSSAIKGNWNLKENVK